MLTWLANLANLLSSGDYKQTQEEAIKYRSGFSDEMKLTNALSIERNNWQELHHRAVQQRDQAGQDLARMTRDKQLANNQRYQWENDARRYAHDIDYWAGRFQEKDSSRSGWEWLYRQKCKQWAKATEEIRRWQVVVNLIERSYNGIITMHRKELTKERELRDGLQQQLDVALETLELVANLPLTHDGIIISDELNICVRELVNKMKGESDD